ncbi:integrin beta-7-like [Pollicipes pollicipes]|uniref:integrin beta-7-like n=1 Tax=Pollicipes pollicipes TaxID=41117 RepID=UPI001885661B|nr:integrin beta-7-like [Pollicipes pollicipes]
MALHRIVAVLWAVLTLLAYGAADPAASCEGQTSCGACLTAHYRCAWCRSPAFGYSRCSQLAVMSRLCAADDIVSPSSEAEIVDDGEPSDQSPSQQPAQLAPRHLRVRLRPHEQYEFEVRFRQAEDYPLDLYYLMDLTYSQWDDKDKLETLGKDMAITLRSLTKNFRVGFGSFVDKPVMPYVSQVPQDLQNPCAIYGRECVAAYGFRNHLNLTNDVVSLHGAG